MGGGRGAGAVGRASDWEEPKLATSNALALATSLEFLRLCFSVGIVKVGVKLLLQFSNFSFNRGLLLRPDVVSVRGELWRASHRKEEEEEGRSGGRLVSKRPVLSRLDGLMMNPTKSQIRRIQSVMANHNKPPRRSEGMLNRKQEAPKIVTPIKPEDDTSLA